jgi:hypothetical protein
MSHDEGASTDVTGTLASAMALMTAGNGSRTSPEKLKPGVGVSVRVDNVASEDGDVPTEDGIHHVICGLQGLWEVVDKGNFEVFELFGESLLAAGVSIDRRQDKS